MAQGTRSIILNNSYKIYCVKCPCYWFLLVFVPYATWAVFCCMDETLDVQFGLLLAIAHWKTAVWKNTLTSIEMDESAITGCLSHYSIWSLPTEVSNKKKFGSSVLYEQLLSSVPYAMVCFCFLYNEQSINYFGQKLRFFFKFNKFQPLKLFFRDF